ncbi:UDP-glucuronosyltransferase 2A1-like [Pristis pectinata]|uniref:UDP-glucuronosyltransferase 2A1-like n=1 Tax=Pristis pectinata TaxID=685728 RepID=UPI00223CE5B6|nr:UDP-glucuronosyltransferase 2A1-like [Pristis pectinata]XP_051865825.1 UDP-glucuronosyltransferase 2A1-like [Pristis pectinata]
MLTVDPDKLPRWLRLTAVLLGVLVPGSGCANILVVPVDGSHWINMKVLLEELRARGHSLSVLHTSTSHYIKEDPSLYRSFIVPMDGKLGIVEDRQMVSNLVVETLETFRNGYTPMAFLRNNLNMRRIVYETHQCTQRFIVQLFEDRRLMGELEGAGFHLLLTDPLYPTGSMLARHLKLLLVHNARWLTNGDCHHLLAPSPPSYVPVVGSWLTDTMSFSQRLSNTIQHFMTIILVASMVEGNYQELCRRYLGPGTGLREVILAADLWLIRVDFVLEFPRPTIPSMVYMGGFQCRPASPLDPELEAFVQGSGEHGVVLLSLGTLVTTLPDWMAETIAVSLSRLPQRVVWRHVGPVPKGVGNNTLVMGWIPQNDLLGHPKVVAFISHGGTNGLYEAIYHGVPVVGLPLIFDQFDNLVRLEARGAAKVLDTTTLRAGQLEEAVREVTSTPGYRRSMHRLSALHRDQPQHPLQRAIYWLEFVLQHGGAPHLRPASFDLPWYIYHGLDVMAFLGALASTAALLGLLLLRCVYQALRGRKEKND